MKFFTTLVMIVALAVGGAGAAFAYQSAAVPPTDPDDATAAAPKPEPNRPTNEAAGAKPRASGRQGSIDVQDGGQDVGSSAGSH